MIITAIILDGFHKGHTIHIEYSPTLRLLKPVVHKLDYCCYQGEEVYMEPNEEVEYKVCFTAVDKKMALYSTKGESQELLLGDLFHHVFSDKPWTPKTELYMGFHNEPIIRRKD